VAPAVSSRSVAAEVPVQSYASSCRLRVGNCDTGVGKYCGVPLSNYSTIAPYSFMLPSLTLILLIIWQRRQVRPLNSIIINDK
jgi:hypothetical protein